MEKTGCECVFSGMGFCERHGINKSPHFHKLCQTHPKYFQMWEECRGPGQQNVTCGETPSVTPAIPVESKEVPEKKLPSIAKQATNFAGAVVKHVATGMGHVSAEKKQERLAICNNCPLVSKDKMRCTECGCHLASKTSWSSSSCPKGYW